MRNQEQWQSRIRRAGLALLIATSASTLVVVSAAHASEIIPSVGLSTPVQGDATAKMYSGVAIRSTLTPGFKGEIGVAYRSESRFDDQLQVRSWPVTASLYFAPGPVYAGAGVGWYQTSFDYRGVAPPPDETKQQFGVHAGGGVELPITHGAGVDLNGRYVMLRDQQSRLVPEKFNPSFWTMSLGSAMHF